MQEQQLAATKDEARKAQVQQAVNDTRARMAEEAAKVLPTSLGLGSLTQTPPTAAGGSTKVLDFNKIGAAK